MLEWRIVRDKIVLEKIVLEKNFKEFDFCLDAKISVKVNFLYVT